MADKKVRDKAGAKLNLIAEKDSNRLFYISKLVSTDSLFLRIGKNSTPSDILYDECSNFIDGLSSLERSKNVACKTFIRYADMKIDEVKIRTLLKDAKLLKVLIMKDTDWYYVRTGTVFGKTDEDVVNFLLAPGNITHFENLTKVIKAEWEK